MVAIPWTQRLLDRHQCKQIVALMWNKKSCILHQGKMSPTRTKASEQSLFGAVLTNVMAVVVQTRVMVGVAGATVGVLARVLALAGLMVGGAVTQASGRSCAGQDRAGRDGTGWTSNLQVATIRMQCM